MRRKAIIIGAPGQPLTDDYLKGVESDIEDYYNYLLSAAGGDWYETELLMYRNASAKSIKNSIATTDADYTITIFAGHGGYFKTGNKELNLFLNDSEILTITDLVNKAEKQLIIIDACRTVIKTKISEPLVIEEKFYNFTGSETRHHYEQHIASCEKGISVLLSCSLDEAAGEDKNGGFFSQSLIKSGINFNAQLTSKHVLDIKSAFNWAKENLKEYPTNQIPEYIGGRRIYHFPFAIKPYVKI
jgi:uncharacterized protein YaaQ